MTAWNEVQRILCVRLDSLGDVLMTTPALNALKHSNPHRTLTLLTSHSAARVAPMLPMIDEVLAFDAPWMKATQHERPWSEPESTRAIIDQLRRHAFDAAVLFNVFSQNPLPAAMLCHLAGIPRCLSYCRENPYQLVSHWIPEPERTTATRHEVERQLALVAEVGAVTDDTRLNVIVPTEAQQQIIQLLADAPIDPQRPWIVVHPGASAPSRRYPVELFARVIERLQEENLTVILTGLVEEEPLVRHLQSLVSRPVVSLAGLTTLAQMAALLERASLLIANNTGPVHLAAAVGTPIVDLYALTNPQHGPWQVEHRLLYEEVPCKNCYKSVCPEGHQNCLRLVDPLRVVQAACELLRLPRDRRSCASVPRERSSMIHPSSSPNELRLRKEWHVHIGH